MSAEALDLLKSIDASLKAMLALTQQRTAAARASAPKPIAADRDLDSKWGDPVVKVMPRDWHGATYKNRKFSECPPGLLDQLAEMLDYFAGKADANNERTNSGKPVGDYRRQDAARARGWAKRKRDGNHLETSEPVGAAAGEGWTEEGGWS